MYVYVSNDSVSDDDSNKGEKKNNIQQQEKKKRKKSIHIEYRRTLLNFFL